MVMCCRREDGYIMKRAKDFVVECHRKKCRLKWTWEKQVEEDSVMVGLRI